VANDDQLLSPWATDKDTINATGVTSQAARMTVGNLAQPGSGTAFTWSSGVYPSTEDGFDIPADLRVEASSPTPNMTVVVNPGGAQIYRTNRGPYQTYATGATTVELAAANASNPRRDYIVVRVRDTAVDGSAEKTHDILSLTGTPSPSPNEPTDLLTDGDLVLAVVSVAAGTSSITTGAITDKRVFVVARGGIYPKTPADNRDGSFAGQKRFNIATARSETWRNGVWASDVALGSWVQWTPGLFYGGGNGVPAGSVLLGTGSNPGNGGPPGAWGRYQQTGQITNLSYFFRYGATGIYCGTGNITTRLPPGMTFAGNNTWISAHLWVRDDVSGYWRDYDGQALCYGNSNVIEVWMPAGLIAGAPTIAAHRVALTNGVAGQSIPPVNGPNGFAQGGEITIQGVVEIQ